MNIIDLTDDVDEPSPRRRPPRRRDDVLPVGADISADVIDVDDEVGEDNDDDQEDDTNNLIIVLDEEEDDEEHEMKANGNDGQEKSSVHSLQQARMPHLDKNIGDGQNDSTETQRRRSVSMGSDPTMIHNNVVMDVMDEQDSPMLSTNQALSTKRDTPTLENYQSNIPLIVNSKDDGSYSRTSKKMPLTTSDNVPCSDHAQPTMTPKAGTLTPTPTTQETPFVDMNHQQQHSSSSTFIMNAADCDNPSEPSPTRQRRKRDTAMTNHDSVHPNKRQALDSIHQDSQKRPHYLNDQHATRHQKQRRPFREPLHDTYHEMTRPNNWPIDGRGGSDGTQHEGPNNKWRHYNSDERQRRSRHDHDRDSSTRMYNTERQHHYDDLSPEWNKSNHPANGHCYKRPRGSDYNKEQGRWEDATTWHHRPTTEQQHRQQEGTNHQSGRQDECPRKRSRQEQTRHCHSDIDPRVKKAATVAAAAAARHPHYFVDSREQPHFFVDIREQNGASKPPPWQGTPEEENQRDTIHDMASNGQDERLCDNDLMHQKGQDISNFGSISQTQTSTACQGYPGEPIQQRSKLLDRDNQMNIRESCGDAPEGVLAGDPISCDILPEQSVLEQPPPASCCEDSSQTKFTSMSVEAKPSKNETQPSDESRNVEAASEEGATVAESQNCRNLRSASLPIGNEVTSTESSDERSEAMHESDLGVSERAGTHLSDKKKAENEENSPKIFNRSVDGNSPYVNFVDLSSEDPNDECLSSDANATVAKGLSAVKPHSLRATKNSKSTKKPFSGGVPMAKYCSSKGWPRNTFKSAQATKQALQNKRNNEEEKGGGSCFQWTFYDNTNGVDEGNIPSKSELNKVHQGGFGVSHIGEERSKRTVERLQRPNLPRKIPKRIPDEVSARFFKRNRDYNFTISEQDAFELQEKLIREAAARVRSQNTACLDVGMEQEFVEPIQDVAHAFPNHWTWSNLYARLGLPQGAPPRLIKLHYRKLALKYHPDKCNLVDAANRFQSVTGAYQALTRSGT